MTRVETVTIIYQPPKILLGMKRLRLGKGKYNGFGGGVEEGESLEECAIRETLEEAGIRIRTPEKRGKVLFQFENHVEQDHLVYFFIARSFEGEPTETDEMRPEWFDVNEIPYSQMWPADKFIFPVFLSKRKFDGNVQFDANHNLKSYEINEVDSIN